MSALVSVPVADGRSEDVVGALPVGVPVTSGVTVMEALDDGDPVALAVLELDCEEELLVEELALLVAVPVHV